MILADHFLFFFLAESFHETGTRGARTRTSLACRRPFNAVNSARKDRRSLVLYLPEWLWLLLATSPTRSFAFSCLPFLARSVLFRNHVASFRIASLSRVALSRVTLHLSFSSHYIFALFLNLFLFLLHVFIPKTLCSRIFRRYRVNNYYSAKSPVRKLRSFSFAPRFHFERAIPLHFV